MSYDGRIQCDARQLPIADECVQCVVTSPPYWGLRDYGQSGQLGLESTPEAYVASMVTVFREVWRVLKADGVCWLNLGDSYNSIGHKKSHSGFGTTGLAGGKAQEHHPLGRENSAPGLKHKDLVGIPWMVARALQSPQYGGRISRESDRAWLAGWLDGEGTVSFVERDRGEDRTPTHDVRVFFTNCDDGPMRDFAAVSGGHVYQHDGERENRYGSRPCFRWQMGTHDGARLIQELYPYLRTKRKQAMLVWTLYTTLRHRNGHASTPLDVLQQRRAIAEMIRTLNRGESVDMPSWVQEPASLYTPGWYLRSDVIWSKPNPMPESVTDRPTRAHEYIFLLTKSERYYYDADAVAEPCSPEQYAHNLKYAKEYSAHTETAGSHQPGNVNNVGIHQRAAKLTRNKRSVWSLSAKPYPEAHYATFPEEIPEICIKAGSRPGDFVLDPFAGSNTTGRVAERLSRRWIACDLGYQDLQGKRLKNVQRELVEVR